MLSLVHVISFTPIVGDLVSFATFAKGLCEKMLHFNPIPIPIKINYDVSYHTNHINTPHMISTLNSDALGEIPFFVLRKILFLKFTLLGMSSFTVLHSIF
jgi:hypothetical protein